MNKHKKTSETLKQKIIKLEQEIEKEFEQTNLICRVKIKGNLYDAEDPLHLEYKISQNRNAKRNEAEVRVLRLQLTKKLLANHPQISEIRKNLLEGGLYRERLIINPEATKGDEVEMKYNILQDIKKEVENYKMQRKHAKG